MSRSTENPLLDLARNIINFQRDRIITYEYQRLLGQMDLINTGTAGFKNLKSLDEVDLNLLTIMENGYGTLGFFLAAHHMFEDSPVLSNDVSSKITRTIDVTDAKVKELLVPFIGEEVKSESIIQETLLTESEVITRTSIIRDIQNGRVVLTNPMIYSSKRPEVKDRDLFSRWGHGWKTDSAGNVSFFPSGVQQILSVNYDILTNGLKLVEKIAFSNPKAPDFPRLAVKVGELDFIYGQNPTPNQLAIFSNLLYTYSRNK